jgi:hypothetical protein
MMRPQVSTAEERAMPKGEQRGNREKKKQKKDKAAKHQSAYSAEYGKHQQPTQITGSTPGKKQ